VKDWFAGIREVTLIENIKYVIKNLIYRFKVRFIYKKHLINTKLPKNQWYDFDIRLLYGNMNLLAEFVEQEHPFTKIDWDGREDTRKIKDRIIEIYTWWKKDREKEIDRIDKFRSDWHKETFEKDIEVKGVVDPFHYRLNNRTETSKKYFEELKKVEDKLAKKETKYLKYLIDKKNYLWT